MKNYLRRKCINFLAKHLYKTITTDDLLQEKKGRIYVRGVMVTREAEAALRDEAERLQDSTLWKLLTLELKHHAIQKALQKSETMEDVIAGKLMIYTIDVINTRLSSLKKRG